MARTNFAPTTTTIAISLILIIVGLVGTYGTWVPDVVGIVAFVLATALLLLGMLVRGI